jgi:hypothetical protein
MQATATPNNVFGPILGGKGEGSLIAMKLALQALGPRPVIVFSRGTASSYAKFLAFASIVSSHPICAAQGLVKSGAQNVIVFAGDMATQNEIEFLQNISENINYICLNNGGSAIDSFCCEVETQIAGMVKAQYSATASVAFAEDFLRKLEKMKSLSGFSFIDVHCPSPRLWGFEYSNTVEISRTAVNSNIWPLLEFVPQIRATYVPEQFEPFENYIKMQSRFSPNSQEAIKKRIEKNFELVNC